MKTHQSTTKVLILLCILCVLPIFVNSQNADISYYNYVGNNTWIVPKIGRVSLRTYDGKTNEVYINGDLAPEEEQIKYKKLLEPNKREWFELSTGYRVAKDDQLYNFLKAHAETGDSKKNYYVNRIVDGIRSGDVISFKDYNSYSVTENYAKSSPKGYSKRVLRGNARLESEAAGNVRDAFNQYTKQEYGGKK